MEVELGKVLGKYTEVCKVLLTKGYQEIVNYFDELLNCSEKPNRVNLLEAILVGVREHEQLLEIYEYVVDSLWTREIDLVIRPIISMFLNNYLDYLEDWKVERLCFRMIRKLNTVCLEPSLLFDILAKGLVRLEKSDAVLTSMIDSLCSTEWCSENVVCLLDVLSNYNLQKTSVEKILDKSLSKIISWNKDKLPEVIQSILLYAFPANIEFLFLRLLSLLYNDKEICSTSSYEAIRGQLMMKMFSLVKDNEDFGEVVFETIKSLSKSRIESEFFFTILMTLLPIRTTQAEAIQLLTNSILRAFSDSHLVLESSFLRAICQLSDDPKEIILKLTEKCTTSQWEFTIHGMIILGFTLIRAACSFNTSSSCGGGSGGGRSSSSLSSSSSKPQSASPFLTHDTLKSRILRSGLDLLVHLFKHCSCSRDEIMSITSNLIWGESSRPIALHALDLLSDLVAVYPLEVAVRANRLDPIIDTIGLLPLSISTALVHALLPLIRAGNLLELNSSSTFNKDATDDDDNNNNQNNPFIEVRRRLIANLCQAANSPRIPSRCTAVACFMLLLKHLKVSVSAFRSASQLSSSSNSLSQPFLCSQSQSTQRNPLVLFSQLKSTQIADQAVLLPCDIVQNEVLCTEIIRILHRVIFSAFFRSQSGSLLQDPENIVKSNIYWGFCEVVTRNRGLCQPVLNLYLRLLTGCLAPNFLKTLKQPGTQNSLTLLTPKNPSEIDFIPSPPFLLDKLIDCNATNGEVQRSEHPDILIWCLQLLLTLPIFNACWRRLRLKDISRSAGSESSEISSSSCPSNGQFSQFTQSTMDGSIQCGRSVAFPLFTKAVNLLTAISNSLRLLPKEDFGLTAETDFSTTPIGKLNRDRVQLLINIYDACLEFELKDPMATGDLTHAGNFQSQFPNQTSPDSAWLRIRQLFTKRLTLVNLLNGKSTGNSQNYGFLSTPSRQTGDFRSGGGLLIMSLISLSQANLKNILIASIKSESMNSLACYILQTLSTRLNQFTRYNDGNIPCVYRDALLNELNPIMKCVIRFYHHKIMSSEQCGSLPSHSSVPTATATATTTNSDDEATNQPEVVSKSRTTGTTTMMSTSTAALKVFDIGLTLALHYLGTQRLHKICRILYPVTENPDYSEHLLNPESCDSEDVDITDNDDDDATSESIISAVTPAQALSSFVKLVKSWVTRLLNPSGTAISLSTQKLTSHNFPHAKDLVILLPILVKLCRVRSTVGSEITNLELNQFNPYPNLSRVLAWLLRLMRSPVGGSRNLPVSSGTQMKHANAIPITSRVQLINQTIWLAHLVGSNSSSRIVESNDTDLSLDDILLTLSTDLTTVLGNVTDAKDLSYIPPDDKETTVTYPLVTRSSVLSILPLIFTSLKHSINEYEWLLNYISINYAGRLDLNDGKASKDVETKLEGNEQEEALCLRLIGLGEILAQLLQTALPAPSAHIDTLLEIGASVFNLLGRLTKYYLRIVRLRYGRFPIIFERLVRVYGREVAPRAYELFSYIQNAESEKVKGFQEAKSLKKKPSGKSDCETKKQTSSGIPQALISRSIKDSRLIPQLIYAIEQYERFLMQLSKKSKVNLMRNVKLSTSRDFRINQATLVATLEQSAAPLSVSSLSDIDDDNDDENNVDNQPVNSVHPVEDGTESEDANPEVDEHPHGDDDVMLMMMKKKKERRRTWKMRRTLMVKKKTMRVERMKVLKLIVTFTMKTVMIVVMMMMMMVAMSRMTLIQPLYY
ncbi:unnamed protein product [Trichobilharzia szidati]|nr:unnamed protein product [Trichobilharzia szidati]